MAAATVSANYQNSVNYGNQFGPIYGSVTINSTTGYDYRERHRKLKDTRVDGAGEWLLNRQEFKLWHRTEKRFSTLWIKGKVGCGKSTLASQVVDNLEKDQQALVLFYYAQMDISSEEDILMAFFARIWDADPKAAVSLVDLGEDDRSTKQKKLFDYLQNQCKRPVYIILDGADELSRSARQWLFEALEEYGDSKSHEYPLRILVTSKDGPTGNLTFIPPIITIQTKDTFPDIKRFVNQEVARLYKPHTKELERMKRNLIADSLRKERDLIAEVIADKSDGMILWAKLQIQNLPNSQESRLAHVQSLQPQRGMEKLYDNILQTILEGSMVDGNIAMRALTLLISVSGSMPAQALLEAATWKEANCNYSPESLIHICGHLVQLNYDRSTFRFAHSSVYEYLKLRPLAFQKLASCTKQTFIAKIYLQYLCEVKVDDKLTTNVSLHDLGPLNKWLRENPLMVIAADRWAYHTRESLLEPDCPSKQDASQTNNVYGLLAKLFKDKPKNILFAFKVYMHLRQTSAANGALPTYSKLVGRLNLAHIVGYFGIVQILPELMKSGRNLVNETDGNGLTALHWAAQGSEFHGREFEKEHERGESKPWKEERDGRTYSTMAALMNIGADVNAEDVDGRTPLSYVAVRGITKVFKELSTDKKFRARCSKKNLGIALIHAAYTGQQQVVELLIAIGASVTVKTHLGTALHAAASSGSVECVELIINSRKFAFWFRSLDVIAGEMGTPLHEAAFYGRGEVVEKLVKYGFAVDKRSESYGSPLQAAAAGCISEKTTAEYMKVFDILLKANSNIDAQGGMHRTALMAAVEFGHKDMVEALMERGANPNIEGPTGTALQIAHQSGYVEIEKILRTKGQSLDDQLSGADDNKSSEVWFASVRKARIKTLASVLWTAIEGHDEARVSRFISMWHNAVTTVIERNQRGFFNVLMEAASEVFKEAIERVTGPATKECVLSHAQKPANNEFKLSACLRRRVGRFFSQRSANGPNKQGRRVLENEILNTLTFAGVELLAEMIKTKRKMEVDLIAKQWTDILLHIYKKLGSDALDNILNNYIKHIRNRVKDPKQGDPQLLARVGVQLLATAVSLASEYQPVVDGLAKLLATCMKDIYELDESVDGVQLKILLQTIVHDVEYSLKRSDYNRVEQICNSAIYVLIQTTTTQGFHYKLSDILSRESIGLWGKAIEMNREQPIENVLNKWLERFKHDGTNEIPSAVRWLFYAAFTSNRESIVQTLSRQAIKGMKFMMDNRGKSSFNQFFNFYTTELRASADSHASTEDQNVVDDILSMTASVFLMLTHDTGERESKLRDVLFEYVVLLIRKVPQEALHDAVNRICAQPDRYGAMGLSRLARLIVILFRGHLNNIPPGGDFDTDPAVTDLVLKNLVWMAVPIRGQVGIVLESDPDKRVDDIFWAIYDNYDLI